jgi:hypothetical protein
MTAFIALVFVMALAALIVGLRKLVDGDGYGHNRPPRHV